MDRNTYNAQLPIFVYGALKPDEISWPLIRPYVARYEEARLEGFELAIVDGVPGALVSKVRKLSGYMLDLNDAEEAYKTISAFENVPNSYVWEQVTVGDKSANLLVLPSDPRTRVDYVSDWSAADDVYFGNLIPLSFVKIQVCRDRLTNKFPDTDYLEAFLELQSIFMMLWVLTERIYLFRSEPTRGRKVDSQKSMKDICAVLYDKPEWFKALSEAGINNQIGIRSNTNPHSGDPIRTAQGFPGWYKARNNIVHRGKGAQKEVGSLIEAAIDMHNTLAILMQIISPSVKKKWEQLTPQENIPYASWLYQIKKV